MVYRILRPANTYTFLPVYELNYRLYFDILTVAANHCDLEPFRIHHRNLPLRKGHYISGIELGLRLLLSYKIIFH